MESEVSSADIMDFLKKMKIDMDASLSKVNTKMNDIENSIQTLKSENKLLKIENVALRDEISKLSDKLDKVEGHSRRNNLIILGIEGQSNESWSDTEERVRIFMKDDLNLPSHNEIEIERAHRFGSRKSKNCPIIVKFNKFKDRENVFARTKSVLDRKSKYFVKEDFTERVQKQRRELSKWLVRARDKGENGPLKYDKLIIEGVTYTFDQLSNNIVRVEGSEGQHQPIPNSQHTSDSILMNTDQLTTSTGVMGGDE